MEYHQNKTENIWQWFSDQGGGDKDTDTAGCKAGDCWQYKPRASLVEVKTVTQSLLQETPMEHSPRPHNGSQPSHKDSDGVGTAFPFKTIASDDLTVEILKLEWGELKWAGQLKPINKRGRICKLQSYSQSCFHTEQTGSKELEFLRKLHCQRKQKPT